MVGGRIQVGSTVEDLINCEKGRGEQVRKVWEAKKDAGEGLDLHKRRGTETKLVGSFEGS